MFNNAARMIVSGLVAAFATSAQGKDAVTFRAGQSLDPQIAEIIIDGCKETKLDLSRSQTIPQTNREFLADRIKHDAVRLRQAGYDPSPCQ